jgi:hypothetical protein
VDDRAVHGAHRHDVEAEDGVLRVERNNKKLLAIERREVLAE